MSRSSYDYDLDQWPLIRWRGAVNSAIRGKRGQAFLREMLSAMDAMPTPRLIAKQLWSDAGEVCALGCVGVRRGIDMAAVDPNDSNRVAEVFGIARALACEIAYVNDEECICTETANQRFKRVRAWCLSQLSG